MSAIHTSAPGSLMILGEHAVLHGHRALVCAVNRRIRVKLSPRADRQVHIQSALGQHRTDLDRLETNESFRFVTAAIETFTSSLPHGFDLEIESEFSHQIGFGSSAAVTVATVAALSMLAGQSTDPMTLFQAGRKIIRTVQGLGSGADVAASVYGDIVAYRADPLEITPLPATHPLTVVYSGSKTPTAEVVRLVESRRQQHPELFDGIFRLMDRSVGLAIDAIQRNDWKTVGALFDLNQGLMEAIGVGTARLAEINWALRAHSGILGAKISGSGLGDCVIGLGTADPLQPPCETLPVEISASGVMLRKE